MSDLVFGVRISGDASGLVGQLTNARTAVADVGAAAGQAAGDTGRLTQASDAAAGAASRLESAERSAAAAATSRGSATRGAAEAVQAHARADAAAVGALGQYVAAADQAAGATRTFTVEQLRAAQAAGAFLIELGRFLNMQPGPAQSLDRTRLAMVGVGQQLQDIVIGLQAGQRATTVFAQQLPQLAFQLSFAEGKIGRFARFLAGPWGTAILIAGIALDSLIKGLKGSADASTGAMTAADALSQAQSALAPMFDLATGKIRANTEAIRLNTLQVAQNLAVRAQDQLFSARQNLREGPGLSFRSRAAANTLAISPAWRLIDRLTGGQGARRVADAVGAAQTVDSILADYRSGRIDAETAQQRLFTTYAPLGALTRDPGEYGEDITNLINAEASLDIATRMQGSIISGTLDPSLRRDRGGGRRRKGEDLARFGREAGERIAGLASEFLDAPQQVERVGRALAELDALLAEVQKKRPPDFEALLEQGRRARQVIQDGINQPYRDFVRQQEESLRIGALVAQGRDAEAAALRAILRLEGQQGPLKDEQRAKILDNVRALEQQERAIERLHERQQLYLSALDETQAAITDTITQVARGNLGSLLDLPSRIFDTYTDSLGRYLADQLTGGVFRQLEDRIVGRSPAEEAADRVAISFGTVQDSARDVARALDGVAAAAGAAAARLGGGAGAGTAAVDNFIALADPAAAAVLGIPGVTVTGRRAEKGAAPFAYQTDPTRLFSDLTTGLLSNLIRGEDGRNFARLIGDAVGRGLEGAAIGGAAGSLVGGSRTGAQIGGALGNIAGDALKDELTRTFGKKVGGFAGPIGSIVGGVFGSLFGGIFGSTKKASATITGVDQPAVVTGNKASYRTAASGLASNVQDAIAEIAEQLGGDTGAFRVSIGVRKGKYRVDPTGAGRTKAKGGVVDFGEDQAAAIAFAIADAIQDGAVTGLSAAVTRALKSSDDVSKALREALKVDELETLLSGPDGELARTFKAFEREAADRLRIARQYGLDVVKTEELNARQRKAILDEAVRDQVGSLQDLLDSLRFGDLFEGSAVDQRNALLAQIATARADAEAGKEGAADRLADLSRQLLGLDRDAFGTAGPELAGDRTSTISVAEQIIRQETERIKAAQDAQLAANGKLDMSNALANEANNILAQILAELRGGGVGPVPGGIGPGLRTTRRQVSAL